MKKRLIHVIKELGVVWAHGDQEFELSSGIKSKFYIDFSKIMMTPNGTNVVVEALFQTLCSVPLKAIGGPSNGADPIIGAMMLRYASYSNSDVRGFTIRKEPKGRGPDSGNMYEGYLSSGLPVVVIEDVTTSGKSVFKAVKEVEKVGAKVIKIISLLDRQAGASELLKDYDFISLVKLEELQLMKSYFQ